MLYLTHLSNNQIGSLYSILNKLIKTLPVIHNQGTNTCTYVWRFMQPRNIQSIDLNINPDWLSIYIYIYNLNPKCRGEILLWGKVYSIVGFSPWGNDHYTASFPGERLQQRNYKVMNFGLSVAYYHYEPLLEVRGYAMRERGFFF